MHKFLWIAAAAILFPVSGWCQQPDQQADQKTDPKQQQQQVHGAQGPQSAAEAGGKSQDQARGKSSTTGAGISASDEPAPSQQESLGVIARKSREAKKESAQNGKVFTNDNIPTTGGISAIGPAGATAAADGNRPTGATSAQSDAKTWREKFTKLRTKLEQDQQELAILQRELGVLDVQYYNDPVRAMQQQLTRSDINDKTAKIDAKKKQIADDQQAIDDAEESLRKSGGDPGWAR